MLNIRKRTAGLQPKEKRRGARYPLELTLRFRCLYRRKDVASGTGRTVDMSSNGLLFATDQYLEPGLDVELAIHWPAQRHDQSTVQLVVLGRVVRMGDSVAAIRTIKFEFRTQGAAEYGTGRDELRQLIA